jgi:hypothetical protein
MLIGATSTARTGPKLTSYDIYAGAAVVLDFENGIYLLDGAHVRLRALFDHVENISGGQMTFDWNSQDTTVNRATQLLIGALPVAGMTVYVETTTVESYDTWQDSSSAAVSIAHDSTDPFWWEWTISMHLQGETGVQDWNDGNSRLLRTLRVPTGVNGVRRRTASTRTDQLLAVSVNGSPLLRDTNVLASYPLTPTHFALGGNYYIGSGVDMHGAIHKVIVYPPKPLYDLMAMTVLGVQGFVPDQYLSDGAGFAAAAGTHVMGSAGEASGIGSGLAGGWVDVSLAAGTATGSGAAQADVHPTARYWRIYVTANDGTTYSEVNAIEMSTSAFGANIATGGTPIASSAFGASVAANAFDGSLTTAWTSATTALPQWVGYDFGAGNHKTIRAIGIWGSNSGYTTRSPKNFDVQYSADGVTWMTAWSVTNSTGWGANEYRFFPDMPVPTSYAGSPWGAHAFWRLDMLSSVYGSYYSLAELEFRAAPGGSDQATGGTATASSVYSGVSADYGFDNNTTTLYHTNGSGHQWLAYQFALPVSVGRISILARADNAQSQTPKQFSLRWSDSSTGPWRTVFYRPNEINWGLGELRTYTDPYFI